MLNLTSTQKQIILGVKMVIFALLSWFFLYQLFYSGISVAFLILTVLGFLFWGILICIGALLIGRKMILYLAFALSLLSFFIFFHGSEIGPGQLRIAFYYFIVLILAFLFLMLYRKRVQREKELRVKLHFWKILKKGLAWFFTFICLLIALACFYSPLFEGISMGEFQIPRDVFDAVLKPISGLLQSIIPAEEIGTSINDFIYELINEQIGGLGSMYKKYILLGLAVLLFFLLRVSVIILVPVVVLFSCFVIKLLIAVGFAKIITKKVDVETIEM